MDSKPATSSDIVFLGKMVAGATHELNNVIAIINELQGLLADTLNDSHENDGHDFEKIKNINDRIEIQTQRGSHLIKQLNNFAHLVDQRTSYDLNEILHNIVEMTRRFANLKKIRLGFTPFAEPIIMSGHPLPFARTITEIIFWAMEFGPKSELLSIAVCREENNIEISIGGLRAQRQDETWPIFDEALIGAEAIGARIKFISESDTAAAINIYLTKD